MGITEMRQGKSIKMAKSLWPPRVITKERSENVSRFNPVQNYGAKGMPGCQVYFKSFVVVIYKHEWEKLL